MPLSAGTRLGPYEILALIGAGGMGEVYRARDPRMGRDVAVKISAEQFSDRFEREVRAVAALNHPNICTLYDVGPNYLVMEFIDGQTLDRLIPAAGMRLADALRVAIRIADGLAAAHKIGIVHRDLKPGNVMVTSEGVVKLLDFGLAAIDDTGLPTGASVITRTVAGGPKTVDGTIVGTICYMSPEQAEGQKLDPRSDLFSFGSLLYEMLTGQQAFRGETTISTLAAILNQEPKPLTEAAAHLPSEMQRIIARCLRKDPDRRFQHASDLRVELQEVADMQSSGALVAAPLRLQRPGGRSWLPYVAAAALAAGVGAGWLLHRPPPPFRGPTVTRATFDSGLSCDPALSPDGKLLAYASDRSGKGNLDIWVQPVNGGEAVQLTRDEADESEPSFSPDGSQIAFRSERDGGGIWVISALGGEPRLVAREGRTPRFSPDGTQIAYWTGKGGRTEQFSRQGGRVFLVPAGGGEPRPIAPQVPEAASPIWSSDGRKLLFVGLTGRPGAWRETWFLTSPADDRPVPTNAADVLRHPDSQMPVPSHWLASNQIIFAARRRDGANLFRVAIDPARARISGAPQQLTFGGGTEDAPSVAANGLMAMADLTRNFDIWSLPINARTAQVTGDPVRLTDSLIEENRPSISPDGRILVYNSVRPGQVAFWVRDLTTGKTSQLAAFPDGSGTPVVSPDDSTVAYTRPQGGARALFTIPTAGGIGQRVLDNAGFPMSWTRSGKIVHLERVTDPKAPRASAVFDPKTRQDRRLLEAGGFPYQTIFSPDETWVAFMLVPRPQTGQVFIAPAGGSWPIPRSAWIPVTDGTQWDDKPVWSPDGNLLYFVSERDRYRCFWAQRLDAKTKRPSGDPFPVQHFHSSRRSMLNIGISQLEVGLAANRIVFAQGEVTGNVWLVRLP